MTGPGGTTGQPLPTSLARGGSQPGPLLSAAVFVAVVAALAPLSALFTDSGWFTAALLAIATVVVTGLVLRNTRTPLALIPLAQCAAFLAGQLLILPRPFDSPHSGWSAALLDYRDTIAEGVVQLRDTVSPAATTPSLVALLALLIFLAALVVETLAVGLGQAGLAGVVPLVAAIVAFGIYPQGASLLLLAPPAIGWLVVLWADQQTRLTIWPAAGPAGSPASSAAPALAIGGAVLAVAGLLSATLLPSIGGTAWLRSLSNSLTPGAGDGSATSLDPLVDVRERLTASGQSEVLTYRTSDGQPRYLGMVTLEAFDGTTWQPYPPVPGAPLATQRIQQPVVAAAPSGTIEVQVEELGNAYLPMPPYTRSAAAGSDVWGWDVRTADAVSTDTPATGVQYRVEVAEYLPDEAALASATSNSAQAGPTTTALPADLAPQLLAIAGQVTEGSESPYAAAVALQDWFVGTGGFEYSLDVPDPGDRDPLLAFLTDRVGYCQQYATAFAALARSLDIPSRVVVGFANGSPQDGQTYRVTSSDAHAWPELWFDGIGWLRFEPTPAGSSAPLDAPPYTPQFEESEPQIDPIPDTADQPEQEAPSDAPSLPAGEEPTADPAANEGSSRPGRVLPVLLLLTGVALVALLAVGPRLVRHRQRRSRLGSGEPLQVWAELMASSIDAGYRPDPADTLRTTAQRWLAEGLVRDSASLHVVVSSVEATAYSGSPAALPVGALPSNSLPGTVEPGPTAAADDVVRLGRSISGELDEQQRPLVARWLPRSLRPRPLL